MTDQEQAPRPIFEIGQQVLTCSENLVTIIAIDPTPSGGKCQYVVQFSSGQEVVLAEAYLTGEDE